MTGLMERITNKYVRLYYALPAKLRKHLFASTFLSVSASVRREQLGSKWKDFH
jgi:hypothetical protein